MGLLLINPIGQILEPKLPCPGDISGHMCQGERGFGEPTVPALNLILEFEV